MEFDLNAKVLLCQPHSPCGCHTPGLALATGARPSSLGFSHKAADGLKLTHVTKSLAPWLQQTLEQVLPGPSEP